MSGPARYTALGRKGLLWPSAELVMPDGALSTRGHWLDAFDKSIARERHQRTPDGPAGGA
jgi:hypothetical protein